MDRWPGHPAKFAFPVPHLLRFKAMTQPWQATVTRPEQRIVDVDYAHWVIEEIEPKVP